MPQSKLYQRLPYCIRQHICKILSLSASGETVKSFIASDLPPEEISLDMASTKDYELYCSIIRTLFDNFEDHKNKKKAQEVQKFPNNYDQFKKKAMALRFDQIIQIKSNAYCSGIGIFFTLATIASQECYRIAIPESIIIGFNEFPLRLFTDNLGILRSVEVPWESLHQEIDRIQSNYSQVNYPASLLKYESYNPEGIKLKSEVVLYTAYETQEIFWKIHHLSYGNNYIVFQEYLRPKTGSVSKVRVQYTDKVEKVYRVHNRKLIKQKKEEGEHSGEAVHGKTDNETPAKVQLESGENLEKAAEICEFIVKLIDCLNNNDDAERLCKESEFFERKMNKFINRIGIGSNPSFKRRISAAHISLEDKQKLFNTFTTKLTSGFPDVYLVTNITSLDPIVVIIKEFIKSSKAIMPKTQKISEIVMDFIEDIKGVHYMLKVHKVLIEEKGAGVIPKWKDFRHVSLFSVTEGSSVTKGKRQQVCCGDYCHLLKRHDNLTSEKIELYIKAKPEYSSGLYKLLKIQNFLNLDSAQSLFNKGNRASTPLTQNMQYKTLRRVILEDRNDPNSLKSIIANLPLEILQELSISLGKHTDLKQATLHNINKKLSWEFELVPVCDMCYKIYSLNEFQQKPAKPSVKEKSSINKSFWKVEEVQYKYKSLAKLPKAYIDYNKMLETTIGFWDKSRLKEKIISSQHVTSKASLISNIQTIAHTPAEKPFTLTNKISSNVINSVCESFDKFREVVYKKKYPCITINQTN